MAKNTTTGHEGATASSRPSPQHQPDAPARLKEAPDTKPNEGGVLAVLNVLRIRREAKRRLDAEERPPLVLPQFMTLKDRLALPRQETRWRIEDWLPVDARVMLSAQYKAGKTTLTTNLIRSLVDGDPWLGTAAVAPIVDGYVVLIDTEMAQTQLDNWHRDQGIRADDRIVPISLRGALSGFNLLDPSVRAQWAEPLRVLGARYLILDCLRPILDALGLDEMHDAGQFLVAFDALLLEAGIPEAAIVQHMDHGAERARGDSRLRDWPDVEWKLVRLSENPASPRFINAFGRDVEISENELAFDQVTRRLTLMGGGTSRREAVINRALVVVLDALAGATEPLSFRSLEREVKERSLTLYPRDVIREATKHGRRLGKVLVERGPKNADLHRLAPAASAAPTLSSPPVRECAAPCDDNAPRSVSECASASIEARTLDTHAEGEIPKPSPHTPTDPNDMVPPSEED